LPGFPFASSFTAMDRFSAIALGLSLPGAIFAGEPGASAAAPPASAASAAYAPSLASAESHWAFQPLRLEAFPDGGNAPGEGSPAAAASSIDRYFAGVQEALGVAPLPAADPATWLRRATYDLTGLPPTPEEVAGFLVEMAEAGEDNEAASLARGRVVERLLASPAYGERWGRHWLDVARYADTAGDAGDFPIPEAWRYRNWVIAAVAADLPYDEFIVRQIAGDLLPAETQEERDNNRIATGYLALSKRFGQNPRDFVHTLDDTVDNLGKAFLGLTVSCARCHDHKFDPIPIEDYYALYGIFESTVYTFPGLEHRKDSADHVPLGGMESATRWEAYLEQIRETEAALDEAKKDKALSADGRKAREKELSDEIARLKAEPPELELAFAASEGKAADTPLRRRGEFSDLSGEPVRRGFLQILGGQTLPEDCEDSGRLHLARWIADAENPLTSRVMANRIWLHHFGRPLVATPDDFGLRSETPEHLALLDWLAAEFVARGWSLKAMHRAIMASDTYARASRPPGAPETEGSVDLAFAEAEAADGANLSYWRYESRRLSAEELRDSLLAISGGLDREPGGRHPFPARLHFGYSQHRPFAETYESDKRSIYLMQTRLDKQPFLRLFDGADPTAATGLRSLSVSPMQALFHLNDAFAAAQAEALAGRLLEEVEGEAEARIESTWMRVYGRPPREDEAVIAASFLVEASAAWRAEDSEGDPERAAWASLARTLFSSNAFAFVR
jgi:hypothetical protein